MSLNEIVNLTITRETIFPKKPGFGVPLLLGYHTFTPNRLDIYSELTDLTDAGFPTYHPIYKMAQIAFSQNPRPIQVAVGRRTTLPVMTIKLGPLETEEGYLYKFTFIDYLGIETAIEYEVLAAATPTTIALALSLLIDPLAGVTATAATGIVTITGAAGELFDIKGLPTLDDMTVENTTANPGIQNDLTAIELIDSTSWYGIAIDSPGTLENLAVAAWTEARQKLFVANTSDSEAADNAVTDDLLSLLNDAAYARTGTIFSQNQIRSYSSVALLAKKLPSKPGYTNWAFSTFAGITRDNLRGSQATNIKNKFGNVYVELAGLNVLEFGNIANGEFFDLVHGTDELYAAIQAGALAILYNASNSGSKVPYTDDGVAIIVGFILGTLNARTKEDEKKASFLAKNPPPTCTAPRVADVDLADRAARLLPDIRFGATLAGAINKMRINGTLSV